MGHRQHHTALGVAAMALLALAVLAVMPGAVAQQYGESQGTLAVSHLMEVSGDGFSPGSTVKMGLRRDGTDETTDLGSLACDGAGRLAGAIALPEGLPGGRYTLTATGVTLDGATRVLSAELQVPGSGSDETPDESSDGVPKWLVVLLATLAPVLAGGAWWWGYAAGRRRGAAGWAAGEPGPSADGPGVEDDGRRGTG